MIQDRLSIAKWSAWSRKNWPLMVLMAILGLVLVRTAWISDDGFISFTSAANLVEGKGFTFQPYERVQAYSNPLWTLLMAAAYGLTGEVWITGMVLGIGITLIACAMIFRAVPTDSIPKMGLAVLLLLSSAFIDFSTSGLENPLSHLLVLLFAGQFFRESWDAKWLRNLFLIASLLLLNRPDFAALVAPVLLFSMLKSEKKGRFGAIFVGLLPILGWEMFSLIYYGFLLPNTWYAKLGVGEGRWFLMGKGLVYAWDTLQHDTVTVLVISGGIAAALFGKNRKTQLLMAGALLYVLAVIAAGGDFMRGRMFTVPFVLSLYVLLRTPLPRWAIAPVGAMIVLGLFRADCPLWSGPDYHVGRCENPAELYPNKITDERALYWKRTGWMANHGEEEHPMRVLEREAKRRRSEESADQMPTDVKIAGAIGMFGYSRPTGMHILDESALSDPLLARLPAINTQWWRAGHRPRVIPLGYQQHLQQGPHGWQDKNLEQYAERLDMVARGPIWSADRWRTIWGFLTGEYAELVDRAYYRDPVVEFRLEPGAEIVNPLLAENWSPLQIKYNRQVKADSIMIHASSGKELKISFMQKGKQLTEKAVKPEFDNSGDVGEKYRLSIPEEVREQGFDALWLTPATFHRGLAVYDLKIIGK